MTAAVKTVVWIALLTIAAVALTLTLRLDNSLSALLPAGGHSEQAKLAERLGGQPGQDRLFVVLEGGDGDHRLDLARKLINQAERHPAVAEIILANATDQLEPLLSLLRDHRYLLAPSPELQDQVALRAAFADRAMELRQVLRPWSSAELLSDPTLQGQKLLRSLQPDHQAETESGLWRLRDPDGHVFLLRFKDKADFAARKALTTDLARWAADFEEVRIHLTGPAWFALQSEQRIKTQSMLLSVGASTALLLWLFAVFRRPLPVLLTGLPLASGLIAGAAMVQFWFGAVHSITLAFSAALLGVGMDYPIHMLSHRRLSGAQSDSRALHAPMAISALTTLLGFASLGLTPFPVLAQVGVLTGVGIAVIWACTRWLLPSLTGPDANAFHLPAPRPGRLAGRGVGLAALVATAIVGLASLQQTTLWRDDPAALNPLDAVDLAMYHRVRQALEGGSDNWLLTISAADADALQSRLADANALLATWRDSGAISHAFNPLSWLPSQARQLEHRATLPEPTILRQRLESALRDQAFKPDAFQPFLDDVQQARQSAPLRLTELTDSAAGARWRSLIRHDNQGWLALLPVYGIADAEALQRKLDELPHVALLHPGQAISDSLRTFRAEAVDRLAWALALVTLALALGLRRAWDVLRVLAVLGCAVTLALAATRLLLGPLNLLNLVALILVAGIAVDYAVFSVRGDEAHRAALAQSLLICFVSTALTFGMLALATVPVLRDIGVPVLVGVAVAYLGTLLLRPRTEA